MQGEPRMHEGKMRRSIDTRISGSEVRRIPRAVSFAQEEFARFLRVRYSTHNRWESGRVVPFGMHLQILIILKEEIYASSLRAVLRGPRIVNASFLLHRLLKLRYGSPKE